MFKFGRKRKEKELKAKIGLRPDEDYLTFSQIAGGGVIHCSDCGYEQNIVGFVHGVMSCDFGRQCPKCYAFVKEHNESQRYHVIGDAKKDFVCPKCGTLIRRKEESILKSNSDPLFCPKCHSARIHYRMLFIT